MNPFWSVTLFWAVAAASVAIALAFVLPSLLRKKEAAAKAARRDVNIAVYRDQMKEMEADLANGLLSEEQFQAGKLELETRLAEDALAKEDDATAPVVSRRLAFTLAGILPAAAFGLYFWLGNPVALTAMSDAQGNPAMAGAPGERDIMSMIQQMESQTRAYPNDGQGWEMLAMAYAVIERWPEALQAYEKAFKLLPAKPSVMTGYAEALAITRNRVLQGRPMELVMMALKADPDDKKGLELAGINAYQQEDFVQAVHYLTRLHRLLPPESPYAQDILSTLKKAEHLAQAAMGGRDNLANTPHAAEGKVSGGQRVSIDGSIDIAPALKARLGSKDTIFVFARPGESGPPAAAIRGTVDTFPLEFSLDDSMAMSPGNVLSQHKEVVLVARISPSGNPMAQPGDFEGRVSGVKVGATGVKLVIDRVLP